MVPSSSLRELQPQTAASTTQTDPMRLELFGTEKPSPMIPNDARPAGWPIYGWVTTRLSKAASALWVATAAYPLATAVGGWCPVAVAGGVGAQVAGQLR